MPPTEVSFRGGLNREANFISMPPGQCMTFKDMQLNYGDVVTRQPILPLNSNSLTSSNKFSMLGWADASSATSLPYIYVVGAGSPGKIYRSSTYFQDTQIATPISYSDVSGSIDPGNTPLSYDTLNGLLVFVSFGINPFKFTSNSANAAALAGSPPVGAQAVKVVNNYMFMAGFPATSNGGTRIYWSSVADPETWPAANFIDFKEGDGDPINALGKIGTTLYIFKGKSIGSLSTNSNQISGVTTLGPFVQVWDNIGCPTAASVDNLWDGTMVFIGSDYSIYITDGYTLKNISKLPPPSPSMGFSFLDTSINIGLKYYHYRKEIWVNSSPLISNTLYVYDVDNNYWRTVTGCSVKGLGICYTTIPSTASADGPILLGSDTNGNIVALAFDKSAVYTSAGTLLDENGSTITAEVSTSILFPQNISESGIYGVSLFSTDSSSGKLYIGYDNTYSSTVLNINTSSKNRFDIPNGSFSKSNSQRPSTIQFKITSTKIAEIFNKVYIDTELED